MAGYSGTPLGKKLGLKEGQRVVIRHAPDGFARELGPLPGGVTVAERGELDLALLFIVTERELRAEFPRLERRLAPAGMLWVAWPKKASKRPTDLSFEVVQRVGLEAGLVDTKICAVNEIWSGLKFVRRLKDRLPAR